MPSLDIVEPVVFHRKRRRKASLSGPRDEKVVKLEGLGRSFRMNLWPNPSLLSFDHFVHLFRHENHSEILSDEILRSLLPCFHHGSVSHHHNYQKETLKNSSHEEDLREEHQIKKGLVALDVCNDGLVSFPKQDGGL